MPSTETTTTASSVRKVTGFPATRLGIVGSRDFSDETLVRAILTGVLKDHHVVVSGGARGVDTWAAETAREMGLQVCEHKPNWDKDGSAAAFIRNTIIVRDSDIILAFWDQRSGGTLNTLGKAKKLGKVIGVVTEDGRVFSNYGRVAT